MKNSQGKTDMSLQATKRISALSRQEKESNFSLFHFIEVDTASH